MRGLRWRCDFPASTLVAMRYVTGEDFIKVLGNLLASVAEFGVGAASGPFWSRVAARGPRPLRSCPTREGTSIHGPRRPLIVQIMVGTVDVPARGVPEDIWV